MSAIRGARRGFCGLALGKRGAYQVRVVECIHKVPCVGYCFSERQTRLVPELARTQAEMLAANEAAAFGRLVAQRRKQGLAVYEEYSRPRFDFSPRHSDREVVDFFEAELRRERPENVVVWARRESLLPEQHQRREA